MRLNDSGERPEAVRARRARLAVVGLCVFLAALGVRLLARDDARLEAPRVQSAVTANYKHAARLFAESGVGSFFDPASPLSHPDLLGHPPGYPFVLALVYGVAGESDRAIQLFQIICDALACVILFLIVAELMSVGVGATAGMLSALSPQFSWNSVLFLPDTLAVLPILAAVLCVVHALKSKHTLAFLFTAGALVGVSCWLRANALLLAPFIAAALFFLFERGRRMSAASAVLTGFLAIVAPLTFRNYLVTGHFIPVSLGAGQTLLEGIADYDPQGRFQIPATDLGIMRQEAEASGRPDYAETLFGPDGIRRERARVARAFEVVRSNPFWFFGVMVRRAASMTKLERARLVSAEPPVTHTLDTAHGNAPAWSAVPVEMLAGASHVAPNAKAELMPDSRALRVRGNETKYGTQFVSAPLDVEAWTDYLLSLPVKAESGRVKVCVVETGGGRILSCTLAEAAEGFAPEAQPLTEVRLPFVSRAAGSVELTLSNEGSSPIFEVGAAEIHRLGPASRLWTLPLRALVRSAQRFFITAVVLPLALAGVFLLVRARRRRALILLLVVPAYYMIVQSAVHTEYRYILAVYHFMFALAAVALVAVFEFARRRLSRFGFFARGRNAPAR